MTLALDILAAWVGLDVLVVVVLLFVRRPRRHRPGLRRLDACVHVDLTPREARAVVRAIDLVVNTLRPELFMPKPGQVTVPPLVESEEVLIAACERSGVDIGFLHRELTRR